MRSRMQSLYAICDMWAGYPPAGGGLLRNGKRQPGALFLPHLRRGRSGTDGHRDGFDERGDLSAPDRERYGELRIATNTVGKKKFVLYTIAAIEVANGRTIGKDVKRGLFHRGAAPGGRRESDGLFGDPQRDP